VHASERRISRRLPFTPLFSRDASVAIGFAVEIFVKIAQESSVTGSHQNSVKPAGDRQNSEANVQRRVLVVDDEQVVCQMIGKVLNSAGMEALTLTRSAGAGSLRLFPSEATFRNLSP